jgi:hypothetical protein
MTEEYCVRLVDLPSCVKAVTVPSDDGYMNIYINARLSDAGRERALKHELKHLANDDFLNEVPIERAESLASI